MIDRTAFVERLRNGIVVADGAMGTEFYARGIPVDACYDGLNLDRPDLVAEVHRSYVAAGARLIETNTFGSNRLRLTAHGEEARARAINLAGARLAREAAVDGVLVAGSVGPSGGGRAVDGGEIPEGAAREAYVEQVSALVEGGVDLLILETFTRLDEILDVLAICREVCDLPVVAQMAFSERGRTVTGLACERAAEELAEAGADVVGANCVNGPVRTLDVVRRIAAVTDVPLSAFPNAGSPAVVDGRLLYLTRPEDQAEYAERMVEAGVTLIGGCCGTGPAYVKELARRLQGKRPAPRRAAARVEIPAPAGTDRGKPPETFLDEIPARHVITVELDPPKGMDTSRVMRAARILAEDGRVRLINVADNPLAVMRLGHLAMAKMIQDQTGIETIVHVSGRDRNSIGTQSMLLGAWALGIRNTLPITGDPASLGNQPGASSVYDVNALGILDLIRGLNEGRSASGDDLGGRTAFTMGVAFNYHGRIEPHLKRLLKKQARGAQYAMTQPVYDVDVIRAIYDGARARGITIPIFLGIMPLVSERNAEFLHHEVPGIEIPDRVRRRMKGLRGKEGKAAGLEITREILEGVKDLAPAFYIIPPFENANLALRVVDLIGSVCPVGAAARA